MVAPLNQRPPSGTAAHTHTHFAPAVALTITSYRASRSLVVGSQAKVKVHARAQFCDCDAQATNPTFKWRIQQALHVTVRAPHAVRKVVKNESLKHGDRSIRSRKGFPTVPSACVGRRQGGPYAGRPREVWCGTGTNEMSFKRGACVPVRFYRSTGPVSVGQCSLSPARAILPRKVCQADRWA